MKMTDMNRLREYLSLLARKSGEEDTARELSKALDELEDLRAKDGYQWYLAAKEAEETANALRAYVFMVK